MSIKHVILAGGCFWKLQAVFDIVQGVVSTTVGYTGCKDKNLTHNQDCDETTNHVEAVLINYDDSIVKFGELLDIFFANHNPRKNYQKKKEDDGRFRSIIFVANDEQEAIALDKVREINEAKIYPNPITTQILRENTFYEAEEAHQKYFEKRGRIFEFIKTKNINISKKESDKTSKNKKSYELDSNDVEKLFSDKLLYIEDDDVFICETCGNPIIIFDNKFNIQNSKTTFDDALPESIILQDKGDCEINRIEVCCAKCGSHLGFMRDDKTKNASLYYGGIPQTIKFE
ncbi:MAG: peptide-methionine (S)-S-oxide reductase MsrA [Alphaproteobacteria bacterium]|nr:peptide-methionine (S)-S-oxide reductase MsrA [Alphaproteobacteria bacterium]